MRGTLVLTAALGGLVRAQSSDGGTMATPVSVSTVIASPSASAGSSLPSQVALPPKQAWCDSAFFCAGEILQTVNLANLFVDQKTFVDKPTSKSAGDVESAFGQINGTNATVDQVLQFVEDNFGGEGTELEALTLDDFPEDPAFLDNVTDPIVHGFAKTVHGYWSQLIRATNESRVCDDQDCETSLLPLNHTFVVPGGRFREQYYWDSFWIVEGLLESELYDIVNDTLQNFMDELDTIGFIPNGMRVYFLNRSQPPLFIQMLERYVSVTNDTAILERALPLAEKELKWWSDNRMVDVVSPTTNKTYSMARYYVNNTAPRPESYLTDYLTANDPELDPPLNESQRADLYAELASGAESGWDYTTRWIPSGDGDLAKLNIRSIIPVDLNSILYKNYVILDDLYSLTNSSTNERNTSSAAVFREGIIDLLWDPTKLAFYDFDLQTGNRSGIYSAANFYPLWSGIIPDELLQGGSNVYGYFSSLTMVLNRYNGTYPATFIETGLQWDAPNAWPPHQYVALKALSNLPSNITNGSLPLPSGDQSTFDLIPEGQLGIDVSQLPLQAISESQNASSTGPDSDLNMLNGTVINGGNATENEGWADSLQRQLANRYLTSTFCSWYASGGSIDGILPQRPESELNITQAVGLTGNMFEKFSISDVDSAGRGGEYQVQAGFGWTNGVLLWVAAHYGDVLVAPACPDIAVSAGAAGETGGSTDDENSDEDGDSGTNDDSSEGSDDGSDGGIAVTSNMRAITLVLASYAVLHL